MKNNLFTYIIILLLIFIPILFYLSKKINDDLTEKFYNSENLICETNSGIIIVNNNDYHLNNSLLVNKEDETKISLIKCH